MTADNTTLYYVATYPADGHSLSWKDRDVREFRTLDEAREDVRRRLGDLATWRHWGGIPDDNDVEAYHESKDEGCGGVTISRE